jgi:putative endonuclease
MLHTAWVYILTNKNNTTLYTGATNDLLTRLWEHRSQHNKSCFTARYNLSKLVYYQGFETILEAVERERYLKGKTRKWKEDLITSMNPNWNDLTQEARRSLSF